MHQISASSPSLATPCHHAEESDGGGGGGGGGSSGSFRDFMSAPACLMPSPTGAAGTFASEKGGCDNNSGSTTTAVRRKNNQISGSADVQQQPARSYGERRSGNRSRRTIQEQELRELLEAIVNQSTSSSSMPEGADVDMPDSPVSGSPQLAAANAADTLTAADKGQHSGDAVTTDAAGGGGGGGGSAAAGSYSHPVVELYRSIGQPLDQASFEELKRRVKITMGKDGAGAGSMSELEDFVGDLNRSSEGVLEGGTQKDSPSPPPPATAMEEEEVLSVGEDCDAMEGVEQGRGGGGGGFEDSGVAEQQQCCDAAAGPPAGAAPSAPGSLSEVILKFTTVADGNESSSFTVKRGGATVGRGSCNDICIPNDSCMGESDHASIVWREGAFHVEDRGLPYGASVRIGTGRGVRDWPLDQGAMFSAGNSVFHTTEIDEDKGMLLEIVAGPLKGQKRRVQKDGANIGRATESTISIADRELSRNHSTIECDDNARSLSSSGWASSGDGGADAGGGDDRHSAEAKKDGTLDLSPAESVDSRGWQGEAGGGRTEYYLCDVGSTNGTYVQLVGPYANSRRLELSDHILIGRTGFSINRYDWGVWEDRGARRAMEDKSVVIQDMGVESLTSLGLGPQTFLAVYDGHGGGEASTFLWQRLHVAIAEALEDSTSRIEEALQQDRAAERLATFGSSGGGGQATRCDDWDGDATTPAGGGWTPSAVFSSSNGGPTPPNPSVESLLHALAMAASSGAGSEDEPRSGDAVAGRGELRLGCDMAPACKDSGESSPRRPPVLPTAPSLPPEWLFGAREVVANATCSDEAAAAAAAAPTGVQEEGPQHDPPSRSGAASDTGSEGDAAAAAGGDAASGVCTETAGGGQAEDPRRQEADGGAGGDEKTFGVPSKPPLPSGSGRQSGAQSPGGGPSRPLASAGLPAEGGGGTVAREGVAKQRAPTAVDRVIEDVVTAAFLATDEEFLTTASKPSSGSTATTAMVLGDRFYGFNVGDSRTILCRAGRAEVVSKDHKPSREDETERIKRAGGMVIQRRVMGELAVSRAFGDRAFKVGIKAILREDSGHQHGSDLDDDLDEDDDEDDGLNHTAPVTGSPTNGGEAAEALAADHNSRTMGRGSSSGQLLPPPPPPPVVAPPAVPAAPPSAPPPPPPAPPAATAGVSRAKPVTDPTGALITAEPEMLSCRITPEDEFVILACDGLFDVFTSDEVVRIVRKELRMHGDTQRVCETLVRKAINERYTQDNVSVVLVVLKKFW